MLQTMNNNTTTTTTVDCKNIFNELVNGKYIHRNTLAALTQSFFAIESGISYTINCDYCCPDCGDVYFFGSASEFAEAFVPSGVFTENDLTPSGKLECCVNYAGLRPAEEVLGNMIIPDPSGDPGIGVPVGYTLCTTGNFNTCLQQLQNILTPQQYESLLSGLDGIVEYSTINGSSMLCNIITQLQLSPVYTPDLLFDYLTRLLGFYGSIVISCNVNTLDGQNIVGATFDKWSIYTGYGDGGAVPAIPITQ